MSTRRAAIASTTPCNVVRRRPLWSVAICCHVLLHVLNDRFSPAIRLSVPSLACRPSCRSNVHDSSQLLSVDPRCPGPVTFVVQSVRRSDPTAATMLRRRDLFVLRVECFFRLGSVYKPNIMYIQFINTLYNHTGRPTSRRRPRYSTTFHVMCIKYSPYWPSGLASQRYVPRPLAPLKPLTLAVRQSHWLYVTVLHFSIW